MAFSGLHLDLADEHNVCRIIRQEVIEPLDLTVTAVADALGVAQANLSKLLNEKLSLTGKTAIQDRCRQAVRRRAPGLVAARE